MPGNYDWLTLNELKIAIVSCYTPSCLEDKGANVCADMIAALWGINSATSNFLLNPVGLYKKSKAIPVTGRGGL
jgi:hypothetical protein